MDAISEIRRLRQKHTDRLLTLLAVLLSLAIFVFAPLQAMGIYLFQGFAIAALLAVIGGMIVISENLAALSVMAICFVANVVIFVLRLYFPMAIQSLWIGWRLARHCDHAWSGTCSSCV
jgi:EamA domain-containing membrane protein RarD